MSPLRRVRLLPVDSNFKVTIPSIVIEGNPTKDTNPTIIRVTKEEAMKHRIGDPININLSGNIKAMIDVSMSDQANKFVDIELAGPEISSVAMSPADFEMKRMAE